MKFFRSCSVAQIRNLRYKSNSAASTNLFHQQIAQLGNLHARLLHRIAFAESDGIQQLRFFAERVEIDRDAKRRAGLVLTTITASDRASFVVKDRHVRTEHVANFLRFLDE